MTLLSPAALALLALALPIVLLYVLRLRRPQQLVPSTILWRRSLEDIQANAPWQRLRPNLLLLLQLLALAALVLTLAHPAYSQTRTFTGDVIVIVDESPSMKASDVAPSRFVAAQAQAHHLVSQLGGGVMSVIGMSRQPHLVAVESSDRSALNGAIDRLRPGTQTAGFSAALSLASSLARSGRHTTIITLTSRDSGILAPVSSPSYALEIVRIGGRLRDLALTAMNASAPAGRTAVDLTVRNLGSHLESGDLDLYADGQLADVRPVTLSPGARQRLTWSQLPAGLSRLEARLLVNDDVSFDKVARVALPVSTPRQVLLVSTGNPWLEVALSLDHSLRTQVVTPALYRNSDAAGRDLVIFDGFAPRRLPATSTLLVGPDAGRSGPFVFGPNVVGGSVSLSAVPLTAGVPSVLHYADVSDVNVARLRLAKLPGWMQPLITAGNRPMLAAGERNSLRFGVLTFDLQRSDWPLRISFPIVMHNLIDYLAPLLNVSPLTVAAGSPVEIDAGSSARSIDITRPNGSIDHLVPPFAPYAATALPGFYAVHEAGTDVSRNIVFASNLYTARGVPANVPAVQWVGSAGGGRARGLLTHVDMAWTVALVGLVLLSMEWWYAWRR